MIVEVVPYSPQWPSLFESEKKALLLGLKSVVSQVHHIGSTSVVGLSAKPIIDIILEVPSLTELDANSEVFQGLGYEVMGEFGIERRRYYRKGGDNRTHQIHAFEIDDPHITRHIAFRDYLIAHPEVMLAYQELKVRLAHECNNDIDKYCDGKDDFVLHHEQKAIEWVNACLYTSQMKMPIR
ncbi:GrpB family protein [Marinomonas sp. C2222]|uniref:GrpB family protein n=1 Tax=Marinomonas sargassi TaxID=2984494 RepID=A0ABT2YQS6_9GAMM|nr:GrpB family protein [Marinomonas sargassi]MCV2402240.1 GrpB family protein [Marinomonas sargassi]